MPKFRLAIRHAPVERDILVQTAEEFIQALAPTNSRWSNAPRDWIYRGHADANWSLLPTALRAATPDYTTQTLPVLSNHSEQVDAEYGLLWEFFRVADGQGLLIPEDSQIYRSPWANKMIADKRKSAMEGRGPWPFEELMSLAALAQHHGVPTRLLDWSTNALVAAYFAASEAALRLSRLRCGKCHVCGCKVGNGKRCTQCRAPINAAHERKLRLGVWCLNWRYVWERWPGEDADQIEVLLIMAPRATNANMHAQGGIFTVHIVKPLTATATINKYTLDSVIEYTASPTASTVFPIMQFLSLPLSEADRLLRLLAMHNVHAASVFPGFGGVVKHLNELRLWDTPPPARDLPIH